MSSSMFTTWPAVPWDGPKAGETGANRLFDELYREFGVPFVFVPVPVLPGHLPFELPLTALELVELAHERQAAQLEEVDRDVWALALPVWQGGQLRGVAVARIVSAAGGTAAPSMLGKLLAQDSETGAAVLRRWAQAVVDRMRSGQGSEDKSNHGLILSTLPSLLSLLYGSSSRRAAAGGGSRVVASLLAGLCETLQLDSLAWIPAAPAQRPVLAGAVALDPAEYRRVVGRAIKRLRPFAPGCWLATVDEARRSYGIAPQCLIVAGNQSKPPGWLVAMCRWLDEGTARELAEALRPVAAAVANDQQFRQLSGQFKELLLGLMRALTAAIDAKDDYTRGHSHRVAKLAVLLGQQLGLDDTRCSNLYLAGLLHDIGKIGIDDAVLKKPGPLTPEEREHIMSHVEIGVAILEQVRWFRQLIPAVRHHHERYDGKGYPDGVAGEQISMDGRILAVADAFDAMYSDRAYRRRRDPEQIRKIFAEGAGSQWDPRVIEAAFRCWPSMIEVQDAASANSLVRAVEEAVRSGQHRMSLRSVPGPDSHPTAVHMPNPGRNAQNRPPDCGERGGA